MSILTLRINCNQITYLSSNCNDSISYADVSPDIISLSMHLYRFMNGSSFSFKQWISVLLNFNRNACVILEYFAMEVNISSDAKLTT